MFESSVVRYDRRGPWGDPRWRGNTSGHLVLDIIETFCQPDWLVVDPMEGSKTSREVCDTTGNPYLGYDLKAGHNILDLKAQFKIIDDVKKASGGYGAGLVFLHPPYWNMMHYSANRFDLCNGTYDDYLKNMQEIVTFAGTLLRSDGIIALLLADLRRDGRTYFLTDDVCEWRRMRRAKLEKYVRILKIQVNTSTAGKTDLPVRLAHEYVTIMRKERTHATP